MNILGRISDYAQRLKRLSLAIPIWAGKSIEISLKFWGDSAKNVRKKRRR